MTATEQPPPIVFVDTETTGVGPDRVAWEIAVVRREQVGDSVSQRSRCWFLPLTAM